MIFKRKPLEHPHLGHPLDRLADFPDVPPDLIPQAPLEKRDEAKLMVLDRRGGDVRHAVFRELDGLLSPGDALILNDVKVFPARLEGRKTSGGRVRLLLLKCLGPADGGEKWASLLTPPLRIGSTITLADGLQARVEGVQRTGEFELVFSRPISGDLERLGRMPLPPYIRRQPDDPADIENMDRSFYQTVFARDPAAPETADKPWTPGAVAAPTAGLHFTEELLARLRAKGVEVATLRLNVGWGTFRPLRDDDYRIHKMLPEEYEIPESAARAVNRARAEGRRVWAVGTTVVRTLESAVDKKGVLRASSGQTALYIYPGYKFRAVDALVTNFHLPRHTPLLLAAAFAGVRPLRRAYEIALAENYRFFSYGDAMAIL
ncbi:MAG: tRNA preQ1(34) S-adenosylmethionine ribosyltransferase-isomerase QueA [Elusimicrobiota bacterium]